MSEDMNYSPEEQPTKPLQRAARGVVEKLGTVWRKVNYEPDPELVETVENDPPTDELGRYLFEVIRIDIVDNPAEYGIPEDDYRIAQSINSDAPDRKDKLTEVVGRICYTDDKIVSPSQSDIYPNTSGYSAGIDRSRIRREGVHLGYEERQRVLASEDPLQALVDTIARREMKGFYALREEERDLQRQAEKRVKVEILDRVATTLQPVDENNVGDITAEVDSELEEEANNKEIKVEILSREKIWNLHRPDEEKARMAVELSELSAADFREPDKEVIITDIKQRRIEKEKTDRKKRIEVVAREAIADANKRLDAYNVRFNQADFTQALGWALSNGLNEENREKLKDLYDEALQRNKELRDKMHNLDGSPRLEFTNDKRLQQALKLDRHIIHLAGEVISSDLSKRKDELRREYRRAVRRRNSAFVKSVRALSALDEQTLPPTSQLNYAYKQFIGTYGRLDTSDQNRPLTPGEIPRMYKKPEERIADVQNYNGEDLDSMRIVMNQKMDEIKDAQRVVNSTKRHRRIDSWRDDTVIADTAYARSLKVWKEALYGLNSEMNERVSVDVIEQSDRYSQLNEQLANLQKDIDHDGLTNSDREILLEQYQDLLEARYGQYGRLVKELMQQGSEQRKEDYKEFRNKMRELHYGSGSLPEGDGNSEQRANSLGEVGSQQRPSASSPTRLVPSKVSGKRAIFHSQISPDKDDGRRPERQEPEVTVSKASDALAEAIRQLGVAQLTGGNKAELAEAMHAARDKYVAVVRRFVAGIDTSTMDQRAALAIAELNRRLNTLSSGESRSATYSFYRLVNESLNTIQGSISNQRQRDGDRQYRPVEQQRPDAQPMPNTKIETPASETTTLDGMPAVVHETVPVEGLPEGATHAREVHTTIGNDELTIKYYWLNGELFVEKTLGGGEPVAKHQQYSETAVAAEIERQVGNIATPIIYDSAEGGVVSTNGSPVPVTSDASVAVSSTDAPTSVEPAAVSVTLPVQESEPEIVPETPPETVSPEPTPEPQAEIPAEASELTESLPPLSLIKVVDIFSNAQISTPELVKQNISKLLKTRAVLLVAAEVNRPNHVVFGLPEFMFVNSMRKVTIVDKDALGDNSRITRYIEEITNGLQTITMVDREQILNNELKGNTYYRYLDYDIEDK